MKIQLHTLCLCLLLATISHHYECLGCLETERTALLQIKASLTLTPTDYALSYYPNEIPTDPFGTWINKKGSDCCSWELVTCDNTSGRIIQLSLAYVYNDHQFLNASAFLPLEDLQHLDLSENGIKGWRDNEGIEKLSKLKDLEVLSLAGNYFNESILPYLGTLTSLKTLDLRVNSFGAETGPLSDTDRGLANISNLKILDLSFNSFSGKIPPSVLSLISLEALSLNQNSLKDFISGICQLKSLKELDLSENMFEGTLPPCLRNLTSLTMVDLSQNRLSGNIPPSLISTLKSLQFISLSENLLESNFSFTPLVDHKFQLRFLDLSNCRLRFSSTDLLRFLHNQHDLIFVDLSHNSLNGRFPDWLVENNTKLEVLNLRNNSISGRIYFSLKHHTMHSIDISNNQFEGEVQQNIGDALPKLKFLNFSNNNFEGTIPSSLGSIGTLFLLDLSSNEFFGEVPPGLALGLQPLMVLVLSNNKLGGSIPHGLFNFTYLSVLDLHNNHFTSIPSTNIESPSLELIDISQNHISNTIPTWIANLSLLKTFVIRENSFSGPIPVELCNSTNIMFMDFSQNDLSGSIPSCLLNIPSLKYLHLQRNKLTGRIPNALHINSSQLLTLDLKHNSLFGNIPDSLGGLPNLRILLLKGNRLSGSVPHALCKLNKIQILDLSNNNLSGTIPSCFRSFVVGKFGETESVFKIPMLVDADLDIFTYNCSFEKDRVSYPIRQYSEQEEVEFLTKSIATTYKGDILNFMAGMDLSCNQFTGNIPLEIGALPAIRALNLSYNQFTGQIPKTLSNLKLIESVDLSHNKLTGEIPSELSAIYTLAVFIVAYNNLSGQIPDSTQFSTFTESSYKGNEFLCGPQLKKQCKSTTTTSVTVTLIGLGEKYDVDITSTLASFGASYFMSLLGIVIVLYVNPYWRRLWFDFITACLNFMFPFCSYFKDV
ncbi:hypothetical protein ACHQM5_003436 [Ranunculus cassubicifolius]